MKKLYMKDTRGIKNIALMMGCAMLIMYIASLAGLFLSSGAKDHTFVGAGSYEIPRQTPATVKKTVHENDAGIIPLIIAEPAENIQTIPEQQTVTETASSLPEMPNAEEICVQETETVIYAGTYVVVHDSASGTDSEMPLEEYVLGALLSEMPTSFEHEALKAQAIACRTYAVYKMMSQSLHESGAQLCTSPAHCQAFCLPSGVSAERYEKAHAAVSATEGQIMCFEGAPVLAVFHASSDGKTRSSEEVWGGKLSYLASVETLEAFNPTFDITKEYVFDKNEFLNAFGSQDVRSAEIFLERTDSDRVNSVRIGEKSMTGGEFVRLFGLRSQSFDIRTTEDSVVITCGGYGHGVGLSQYGAQDMAQKGYTCREILSHYYTGISFGYVR